MKITMAQLNPVVGDINGNLQRLKELWLTCDQKETDLLILPELFLVGYPRVIYWKGRPFIIG